MTRMETVVLTIYALSFLISLAFWLVEGIGSSEFLFGEVMVITVASLVPILNLAFIRGGYYEQKTRDNVARGLTKLAIYIPRFKKEV